MEIKVKKIITMILVICLLISNCFYSKVYAEVDYDKDDIWTEASAYKYLQREYDSSFKIRNTTALVSSDNAYDSTVYPRGVFLYMEYDKDDTHYQHNCAGRVYLDGKRVLEEKVTYEWEGWGHLTMVIDPTYLTELNKEYYAYATIYDYDTGIEEKICGIYFVLYKNVLFEKANVKLNQIAGKEQIKVSWMPVEGAKRYQLYRSKNDENQYKLLYDTGIETVYESMQGKKYLDSAVVSGRKYSYYVKTYFDYNEANSDSEKAEIVVDINADGAIPPEEIPTTVNQETTTELQTTTLEPNEFPPAIKETTTVETTTPYQQPTDEAAQTSTTVTTETSTKEIAQTSTTVATQTTTETTTTKVNLETTTKTKGSNVPKKVKKSIHLKRPVLKVKRKSKARQIYWGIISDKSSGIELYMKNGMGKYKVFRKINITTRLKRRKKKKGIVGILISNKSLVKGVKYKFRARTFVKVNKRKVYSKWSKIVIIKK